jgi:hypothetical protein
MQKVELVSWKPGMQKVSCTRVLQASCELGLAAAMAKTEALLEGRCPTVSVASAPAARRLILQMASLGAVARLAEGANYTPQARFDAVFALVAPLLPPATAAVAQALGAQGDWELALSHCMAGLSSQAPPAETERLLSEVLVEFGLALPADSWAAEIERHLAAADRGEAVTSSAQDVFGRGRHRAG